MDRLKKLGILQRNSYRCVLCNLKDESNEQLFIHCSFVWEVWGECISWFKISWIMPTDLKILMEVWFDTEFRSDVKRQWLSCFFVAVWSTWKMRNKVIFENGMANRRILIEQIRFCGKSWIAGDHRHSSGKVHTLGGSRGQKHEVVMTSSNPAN